MLKKYFQERTANQFSGFHFIYLTRTIIDVQIYILLYKEVSIALKINSLYSKRRLLNIHENVRVLRYPDHLATGIYYWYVAKKYLSVRHFSRNY